METRAHRMRMAFLAVIATLATIACMALVPAFGHVNTAHAANASKAKAPAKAVVSKVTSTKEGEATVKVKKEKGAKGYQVKASQSKKYKGKTTKAKKSKKPTVAIGKLAQGKTYYVKARTYSKSKNGQVKYSKWSDSKSVRISNGVAKGGSWLIEQAGSDGIRAYVIKIKGATGYEMKASTSQGFEKSLTRTVRSDTQELVAKGLTQGATYYAHVRGYKMLDGKRSYGKWSSVMNVTIKANGDLETGGSFENAISNTTPGNSSSNSSSSNKPPAANAGSSSGNSSGSASSGGASSGNTKPDTSGNGSATAPTNPSSGSITTPANPSSGSSTTPTNPLSGSATTPASPSTGTTTTPSTPAQDNTKPVTPTIDPLAVTPELVRLETPDTDQLKAYVKRIDNVSGYELQVSQSSSFAGSTTKSTKEASPEMVWNTADLLEMSIDKLTSNSIYFARFRAYTNANNKTSYGKWSSSLSLRTCKKVGAPEITSTHFYPDGKGTAEVSEVPGVDSIALYEVEACTSPTFDSTTLKNITLDGNIAYFQDSRLPKLEAGKTWYLRARAQRYNKEFSTGVTKWGNKTFSGSNYYYGDWGPVKKIYINTLDEYVKNVASYSYKVTPVNGKLNNMIFVETNNPDPMSIQLIDESSKYLSSGKTAIFKPLGKEYRDIVYSDTETLRIANKGYLFFCYNCDSDGGTLKLMANVRQVKTATIDNNNGTNYETGKTIYCQALEDKADYLIRTYAAGKTGLFNKLDAVQRALDNIAIYPKWLYDSDKPTGYAHFSQQRYPELGLRYHTADLFEKDEQGIFLTSVYGFTLDSLSFPGLLSSIAKRLDSSCTVKNGSYHYQIVVTLGSQSKIYGGGGTGGTTPFYSKIIAKTFKFDGTDIGYGTNLSLDTLRAKYMEYVKQSNALAESYEVLLDSSVICRTVGDGSWVSVKSDTDSTEMKLSYFMTTARGAFTYASNAWVDGRYVGPHEIYVAGAKFEDHPKADIILKNVSYVDINGKRHYGTVTFSYYSSKDCWMAPFNYFDANTYDIKDIDKVPSSLILTRTQVEQMVKSGQIDGRTNTKPTAQYIYDGTAAPGTRA